MSDQYMTTPTRPPHPENNHGRGDPGIPAAFLSWGCTGAARRPWLGYCTGSGCRWATGSSGPPVTTRAAITKTRISGRCCTRTAPILAFLESRFARRALWGLKEPAILEAINDLGGYLATRTYRIIATDREPLASVRSYLWKWPTAKPADVVRLHDELRAQRESFLQRHQPPTLWVWCNDLTARPAEGVRSIVEFVFAGRPAPPLDAVRRAADFIDPGLNNHRELSGD
jgi:hypothetical protein